MATGPLLDPRPWRFVVTGRQSVVVTLLDRLASNRSITSTLNGPSVFTCDVPSDNPEVNIIYSGDGFGDPFVSFGDRLIYGFRQEGFPSLYELRWAGMMNINDDDAGTGQPYTHITAQDPWTFFYSNPLITDSGTYPSSGEGWVVSGQTGNATAIDILTNCVTFLADPAALHVDFGLSGFYGGVIETTDPITAISFTQQDTLGSALDKLTATGTMDITLTPIFDQINRPGYTHELNIFVQAGQQRPSAVFAWDLPSRSLTSISRLLDGTQIANRVQYFQNDGTPVDLQTPSPDTAAQYGQWWILGTLAQGTNRPYGNLLGLAQAQLQRAGRRTVQISPSPQRSPVPFLEYNLGDNIPVYASKRLRQQLSPAGPASGTGFLADERIYGFTLDIDDSGVETVSSMLISADGSPPSA